MDRGGGDDSEKGMPILKKVDSEFQSVEDLPRTAVGFSSKAHKKLPPQVRLFTTRRIVSQESGCLCPVSKDHFTAPPNFVCRST